MEAHRVLRAGTGVVAPVPAVEPDDARDGRGERNDCEQRARYDARQRRQSYDCEDPGPEYVHVCGNCRPRLSFTSRNSAHLHTTMAR